MFFHLNASSASRLLVKGKRLVNTELEELNTRVNAGGVQIDNVEGVFVTFVDQENGYFEEVLEDNVLHIDIGFDASQFSRRREVEFIRPFIKDKLQFAILGSQVLAPARDPLLSFIEDIFA